ncbi:hypothetical protein [Kribbella sp. NPDC003557]|uniref:Imm32 family immunity protein n=1 Tax=Kribbella sp. NPDC003557 TaxID=3154449 RepID=UPI0033A6983A
MAKYSIEVADYDASRGVVVLTEEGGDIVVRLGSDGVKIEANPAGLRDLARWCLALADPDAPAGAHIHMNPGQYLLTGDSESLTLGRSDPLRAQ